MADYSGTHCKTCHFYVLSQHLNNGGGVCHRYPATVPKLPNDWCGEFVVKPAVIATNVTAK